MELSQDTITFGKYRGKTLSVILKDRGYCEWLLKQDWFLNSYEYLYNTVKNYDPKIYFLNKQIGCCNTDDVKQFISEYTYFYLTPIQDLKINLDNDEKTCYIYYLSLIDEIKQKISNRSNSSNPYNIKAPVRWLKIFENRSGLSRDIFKTFLSSYELPNIPYIIEDVKKVGGIEYKGAKSYIIAKDRSVQQEQFWEQILRIKYGEDLGVQFKFEGCIFDFIHIPSNTIFEAKLSLKDFNADQHKKYLLTLNKYKIIYLIGYDCVVNINRNIIYTLDSDKYVTHQVGIPYFNSTTDFDYLIENFDVEEIEKLSDVI